MQFLMRVKNILKCILPSNYVIAFRDRKNMWMIRHRAFKFKALTFELSSLCSLRCELCSVPYLKRSVGNMKYDDFTKIIEKIPTTVKLIRFNFAGEPLMNPEAFRMIKFLSDIRPDIHTLMSTNGEMLDRFNVDDVLGSGLGEMRICIDGATQEQHSSYRKRGDFGKVVTASKALAKAKRDNGGRGPVLIQQTLVHNGNMHQLSELEELAREIGFEFLHLRWIIIPGHLENYKDLFSAMPGFDDFDEEYFKKMYAKYSPPDEMSLYASGGAALKANLDHCTSYEMPFILHNGDVAVCCHDPEGQTVFSNFLNCSLEKVYDKIPAERIFNKKFKICSVCDLSEAGTNFKEIDLRDRNDV